ncbi:MAG: alkaline phosphatase family protein [Armatimonadota bacterium]|nr:alkaline phosphatase family protein [Armatimonadota bacterium]
MKRLLLIFSLIFCFASFASAQQPKYAVVIVVDGMRPDYMTIASMPNLQKLIKRGSSYTDAWVGGVVNNTPPSHASIASGCFTRTHGIVAFTWKDPITGEERNPTMLQPIMKGELAKIASENNAPSLGKLLKEHDPSAKIAAVGAHKFYAVGALAFNSADYSIFIGETGHKVEQGMEGAADDTGVGSFVKGKSPPKETYRKIRAMKSAGDDWGMEAAVTVLNDLKPQVMFINLPVTDGTGHAAAGILSPNIMRPVLENVDMLIGKLVEAYKKLGIYDETLFIVTADHGMMFDESPAPGNIVNKAMDKYGVKIVTSTGNGPIWISDSSKSKDVAEYIMAAKPRAASGGYYKTKVDDKYVYKPVPTTEKTIDPKLAATYEYLLSTVACANGPDIFLCSIEPTTTPPDIRKHGRHYQIAWGAQHIPMVFAGPGIKKGFVSKSPARIVDIAPTVLALMGVEPKGMDGIVLADILKNPKKNQKSAQKKINAQLTPARDALRDQSKYDPTAVGK